MQKKKTKKLKVKKSKTNRNLVLYVEDNTLKCKVFKDSKSLTSFVKNFNDKHPPGGEEYPDNWLDMVVTDIKGKITSYDLHMEIG